MYFEGHFHIRKIEAKTYVPQNSKITLRAETAPGQYRPTQPKPKAENQGECFAPFPEIRYRLNLEHPAELSARRGAKHSPKMSK